MENKSVIFEELNAFYSIQAIIIPLLRISQFIHSLFIEF